MEELPQNQKLSVPIPGASLFRNTNFLYLWATTLCSSFALAFFMFSQTWYIVKALDLEASLGLVFVASSVPRLIFMIVGGVVADKFPKKNIMFFANLIRAFLVTVILVWLLLGHITLYTFVLFALFFGLADAFFWSADSSILPELVEKHKLTQANSITQMTNQSSFILGPMFAGFIIKVGNYETIFVITIVMLFISAMIVQYIHLGAIKNKVREEKGMLSSIRESIVYVKQSSFLTALLICSTFLNFFLIGPMQVGFPIFVKNVLHGDSLHFSYLEGSAGGGMAIGAILVALLNLRKRRGWFCLIMLLLAGVSFLLLNYSTVLWQALLAACIFGITLAMAAIPLMSVIQSTVHEEMMGRVMSLLMLSSMGLIPISYAATALFLAAGLSVVTIMKGGAIALILFVLFVAIRVPAVRTFD